MPEVAKSNILIAEDNADMRGILKIIFEPRGFSVDYAEDGLQAYGYLTEFLKVNPASILHLISDVSMGSPKKDGLALYEKIQALEAEQRQRIKFIFLTSDPALVEYHFGNRIEAENIQCASKNRLEKADIDNLLSKLGLPPTWSPAAPVLRTSESALVSKSP